MREVRQGGSKSLWNCIQTVVWTWLVPREHCVGAVVSALHKKSGGTPLEHPWIIGGIPLEGTEVVPMELLGSHKSQVLSE